MKHTDFVDSAIQDLLDRGLIVTCDVQPNFHHYKQNTHLLQIQFPAFVWVAGLLLTNGQLALQCLTDPQA
jgi:hypothetical protein